MSRETLVPKLAAHVLKHGLADASLRPLAKAAGTSDRMLIYHFGNKRQLIIDVLAHIAEQYATALDNAMGKRRATSRKATVSRILTETRKPRMQPFLVLWWEIVAGCARERPGYREAAESIMDRLLAWLETEMPADDPDPRKGARLLLTLIEGSQMLTVVGRGNIARDGMKAGGL